MLHSSSSIAECSIYCNFLYRSKTFVCTCPSKVVLFPCPLVPGTGFKGAMLSTGHLVPSTVPLVLWYILPVTTLDLLTSVHMKVMKVVYFGILAKHTIVKVLIKISNSLSLLSLSLLLLLLLLFQFAQLDVLLEFCNVSCPQPVN